MLSDPDYLPEGATNADGSVSPRYANATWSALVKRVQANAGCELTGGSCRENSAACSCHREASEAVLNEWN